MEVDGQQWNYDVGALTPDQVKEATPEVMAQLQAAGLVRRGESAGEEDGWFQNLQTSVKTCLDGAANAASKSSEVGGMNPRKGTGKKLLLQLWSGWFLC